MEDENVEYRTQAHLMDLDGTSDDEPTELEIKAHALSRGFDATDVNIFFDNMMKFWRFSAKIEERNKEKT